MGRFSLACAAFLFLFVFSPGSRAEEGIGNEPAVRGWAMVQNGPTVTAGKDVVRGDVIPDTIKLAEVPEHPTYGFIIINTERVIVDLETRKVLAVY
jgi:hypothetical protein